MHQAPHSLLDTNPWTTRYYKVFAEGQRVEEIPLARPADADHVCDGVEAKLLIPFLRRDRRRMFRRLPFCSIPGYAPICMDSNDPDTVACGFKQRLARKVPVVDPGLLKEFQLFCRREADKLPSVLPATLEEYLAQTHYNEARKEELREADRANRGGPPPRNIAQRVSAFVKTESYGALKHCRWIASRVDRFKVFAAPAAKVIESIIYEMPEFIKHTPVPERPAKVKSLTQAGRRYYLTDFTAFESHFVPEVMLACECEFYRHILKDWEHTNFMISVLTGKNMLRTPLGVKAEINGRRMSGEMFTSVGNGLTNLMLAKFIAFKQHKTLTGFVEGDDGLFATEADLNADLYRQLGFSIKIVEVVDPCSAIPMDSGVEPGSMAFCGLIFAASGEIIKDYRRFFENFGWTSSFINAGEPLMMQLLRCKALSACYETPQCPIVGALARRALRETQEVVVTSKVLDSFVDAYHQLPDVIRIPKFAPSHETRDLFERTFGISVQTQILVEGLLEQGYYQDVSQILQAPLVLANYADRYVVVT